MVVPIGPKSFDSQGFPITAAPACTTIYNIAASPVASPSTPGGNVALAVQADTSTNPASDPSTSPIFTPSAAAARSYGQKNIVSLVDSFLALVASFVVFLPVF